MISVLNFFKNSNNLKKAYTILMFLVFLLDFWRISITFLTAIRVGYIFYLVSISVYFLLIQSIEYLTKISSASWLYLKLSMER